MPKVTQLPGHQGAKCSSRWALAYSPVLSILPTGLCTSIFSSAVFSPCPAISPFSAPICCPFPVFCLSLSSVAFWVLCLTLSLSLSPLYPCPSPSVSSPASMGPDPQESGHSRSLETTQTPPSLAILLPCGCSRKGGQRAEDGGRSSQTWNWGLALIGKEMRKQGTWGQRVWGIRLGKGCPRAINQNHSRLYEQIWS